MSEKPLIDIEGMIKKGLRGQTISKGGIGVARHIEGSEGLELKTKPYTWKESVVDEPSLNRHKKMMRG